VITGINEVQVGILAASLNNLGVIEAMARTQKAVVDEDSPRLTEIIDD
jgi:hypothetical protein